MESPRKAQQLIGHLLLILLVAGSAFAAYTQYQSALLRSLANKENTSVYLAILTHPAMTAVYNPQSRKAVLTTVKRRKTLDEPSADAADLFQVAGISARPVRYYVPRLSKRDEYWQQFKNDLISWRNEPYIAVRTVWDYLQALHDKRTNLSPAEFLLLAMDATRLEPTDFTVNNIEEDKKKKGKPAAATEVAADSILPPVEDLAPLAVENRPLVLEILNASGVKGAALELTQYLREKNQKGLLNVDVLNYENYPGERQKKTRIIDYTGRRTYLKQLSTAIGVNNEITSEKQDASMFDARIIIGEDFKQPM